MPTPLPLSPVARALIPLGPTEMSSARASPFPPKASSIPHPASQTALANCRKESAMRTANAQWVECISGSLRRIVSRRARRRTCRHEVSACPKSQPRAIRRLKTDALYPLVRWTLTKFRGTRFRTHVRRTRPTQSAKNTVRRWELRTLHVRQRNLRAPPQRHFATAADCVEKIGRLGASRALRTFGIHGQHSDLRPTHARRAATALIRAIIASHASCGVRPWRIISTINTTPPARTTSSPTPVAAAAPPHRRHRVRRRSAANRRPGRAVCATGPMCCMPPPIVWCSSQTKTATVSCVNGSRLFAFVFRFAGSRRRRSHSAMLSGVIKLSSGKPC